MKIQQIQTTVLKVPNSPPASTYYPANTYILAHIRTDEGIEGLGYTMLIGGGGAEAVHAYLQNSLIPLLAGENPLETGRVWQKMYENDRGIRKKGVPIYAISALDIGLWDIVGKAAGRPLWQLFGGSGQPVPVYGSGGFLSYSVDQILREAEGFLAQGCRHYKMKIGRPNLMENVERVAAVRKGLGDSVGLMVDANQRWDVATNLKVAPRLEPLDLTWYEEPVLADNIAQCAEVARSIRIPVATGENEATRYGFRDLIEHRAAHYLQPDIHRCGGFTELMRIAHLAAAYDLPIAPHLVPELSIHVLASIPNASFIEWLAGWSPELFADPPRIVAGTLSAPTRPGHGVAFNSDALKRYAV
jgi:L-alanine-DL-glutamate epimerase-like enolase superfamily enzyme